MVRNKNKTKLLSKKINSLRKRSARAITPEEVNKLITSLEFIIIMRLFIYCLLLGNESGSGSRCT